MKKLNVVLGLALACSLGTAHAALSSSNQINTCDQLIDTLEGYESTRNHSYKIVADLDCSDSRPLNSKRFPDGFTLDGETLEQKGQSHKIKNLKIVGSLFTKRISHSKIRNLHFIAPEYIAPDGQKLYLIGADYVSDTTFENVLIDNPSSNDIPVESVFKEFRNSTLTDFTLNGGNIEFQGRGVIVDGSLRESVLDKVKVDSVKHIPLFDIGNAGLLASNGDKNKISNLMFDHILVSWSGTLSHKSYSFLINDSKYDNTVNNVNFGEISYPGPADNLALLAYINRDSNYGDENSYTGITHKFWGPADEPLFPLFVKNRYGEESQITPDVRPADDVEPVLPPEMCKPFAARDTYFGLPDITVQ